MELALGFNFLVVIALIAFGVWEREQWRKERGELLLRIQAPERAAILDGRKLDAQPVAPIALDDDQAYEKLRLERQGLARD
jgi:hypothetical protein